MLDSLAGLEPLEVFAVLGLVAVFLVVIALKIAAMLAVLCLPFSPANAVVAESDGDFGPKSAAYVYPPTQAACTAPVHAALTAPAVEQREESSAAPHT